MFTKKNIALNCICSLEGDTPVSLWGSVDNNHLVNGMERYAIFLTTVDRLNAARPAVLHPR